MSNLKNKKILNFENSFTFVFVEEKESCFESPISNYYLKAGDLSVNLFISLKWSLWGYKFLKDISKGLGEIGEDFYFENLIEGSIQNKKGFEFREESHELIIDNQKIDNEDAYVFLMNDLYNEKIFDENTKLHFKLKINLREFIILSYYLFPTFGEFS